jgi:putative FmdB family regulatory protein
MPIFEYRCATCNHAFEELILTRNQEHVECPNCGGSAVEPLVSRFAAQTGNKFSNFGECASRAAGICEAGGGTMT